MKTLYPFPLSVSLFKSSGDEQRNMHFRSIREEVPHIFNRPVLTIEPQEPLFKAATFLAIGPQIYADGLVVLDGDAPAGRIGSKHIIKFILESQAEEWQQAPASRLMDPNVCGIDAGSSLDYALDVFDKTKFAFAPITTNYKLITSLSIRDIQRLVVTSSISSRKLDEPAKNLGSPIVSVKDQDSVGNVLAGMIRNNIRNIVVTVSSKEENGKHQKALIINDRKILEFLLSHKGQQIMSEDGIKGLYEIKISELELLLPYNVDPNLTARKAAELMSADVCTPCLLISDRSSKNNLIASTIVTPWDIVMKGLYRGDT